MALSAESRFSIYSREALLMARIDWVLLYTSAIAAMSTTATAQ